MAEFLKAINMKGFDIHRTPRWQMVPALGTRFVILRGGAGLTVTTSKPWVVLVKEVPATDLPAGVWGHERTPLVAGDRVFCLLGLIPGSAVIHAAGGAGAVDLEVDVKPKKTVGVTFTFIKDNAGHKTSKVPAQAAEWIKTINYIFTNQSNVEVVSRDARWRTVAKNLGPRITTLSTAPGEEVDIYPEGDPGADFNIFLVWDLEITDDPGDETGFNDGTNILKDDSVIKDVAESIAHELGHALGLPDQYTVKRELMYGYTSVRGVHLSKTDVNIVNKV